VKVNLPLIFISSLRAGSTVNLLGPLRSLSIYHQVTDCDSLTFNEENEDTKPKDQVFDLGLDTNCFYLPDSVLLFLPFGLALIFFVIIRVLASRCNVIGV
jgi:hypothetical protein